MNPPTTPSRTFNEPLESPGRRAKDQAIVEQTLKSF
jgi:hypothetical protein